MRVDGKVVVITGAASGFGLAMAKQFCAAGALVVGGDIDVPGLDALTAEITGSGGKFISQKCDVAQRSDTDALIARAAEAYGGVDVLINNAGIMDRFDGVAEVSDEMWDRVMGINVNGAMYCSRAAIPHMQKRGSGVVINIGSTSCYSGAAAGVAYAVSKHALAGLTQSIAWHYAQQNIRCVAIAAGGAPTTKVISHLPPEIFESPTLQRLLPFMTCQPRMVTAEDVANMALFLASDLAGNVSGAIIPLDAGWCATGA